MANRPILILPDPRLRAVADPVEKIDDEIKTLAKDMLDTMYDAPGIGLAATADRRDEALVVMDLAKEDEPADPIVMINPEILKFSDETVDHRGGVPVDPRALLRRRAAGRSDGPLHRSRRQGQ